MDNRRDKDKEFDRAQAMDRLSQDDKDKMSLIKMMMDKEKESMKEADIENYELEDEDIDNPDEDLVIIGSGYLDIKNKFKGRPNMTNGELATIGQKVVDKLHKGDKDAAIDYIMSKINENMYIDNDEFEMEMVVDKAKEIAPILKGIDMDTIISFVKTHRQDIRGASDDEIRDEFEEFMSVNTEYVKEEDNVEVDVSDAAAGDSAIERESASGAFEEAINWRGETLKEQFKRLSK
tara:strand:- start:154 stop:858 length:705 start_codon:yes stop_codon:yes gene_type:complete